MKQPRIAAVVPTGERYMVDVTWADGSRSRVDLSEPIGRLKVFAPLRRGRAFDKVRVADHGWAVAWSDDIDYSASSLRRLAEEQAGDLMPASEFRAWRQKQKLSLTAASRALGISRRMIAYYDSGTQPIPKTVRLACRAIQAGLG